MKYLNFKATLAGLGLAAAMGAAMPAASAEEVTLTFATLNPPGIPINQYFLHPWAEAVNADGEGIIKIDVKDGYALANFGNVYDRVLDDVIQVAFALQPPIGGQFLLSEVAGLPFVTDNATDASVALWRLYETGALDEEYSDIVPIALVGVTQAGLHLTEPLEGTDLGGRKILVTGQTSAEVIEKMGGVPQSLPLTDMYEALQRGTVQGTAIAWTAFPSFNLADVTKYHIDSKLGASTAMVFMSRAKWDSLSQEARDVLSKHIGEAVSHEFGDYWDTADPYGKGLAKPEDGHVLNDMTAEQEAAWSAMAAEAVEAWAAARPNGAAILAQYKELLAAVKAEH